MNIIKYITVLAAVCFGVGDTGGHGESHHDHVKLHVPEFIHHDHHTKVITIHHHHHKPKDKHYHHHHHHHHKPHVPYGHHYHKHHKKTHTKTHTTTSDHSQGNRGSHGSHVNHGQYGYTGYRGQTQKPHTPSFHYDPNPVTFEDDMKSFVPLSPSGPVNIPQIPQVYGVQHTVKQVKVFDSLPGAIPTNKGSHGYEVTEEGEQSDDDAFTAINSLSQAYPGTFGFVRSAGNEPSQNDILADFPVQSSFQASNDPFASGPHPTSYGDAETFSTGNADPFSSLAPSQDNSPENIPATGYDETAHVYPGDIVSTSLISSDDALNENTPVSFSREAGIQESIKTGNVETIEY